MYPRVYLCIVQCMYIYIHMYIPYDRESDQGCKHQNTTSRLNYKRKTKTNKIKQKLLYKVKIGDKSLLYKEKMTL
jgi:hypothetical protein